MKRTSRLTAIFLAAAFIAAPAFAGVLLAGAPQPSIELSDLSYDFGYRPVTAGPGRVFSERLINVGSIDVEVFSISIEGNNPEDFQILGAVSLNPIPEGTARTVKILYSPRLVRASSADLIIETNDSDTPTQVVPIQGIATNSSPFALTDEYVGVEDTPLVISVPGILRNDTDVDGNYLGLISELQVPPSFGQVEVYRDGSVLYVPNKDFNGTDQFSYRVDDGFSHSDSDGRVFLSISSVIDAPKLAQAQSAQTGPTNSRSIPVRILPAPAPDPPQFVDMAENIAFAGAVSVPYTGQTEENYTLAGAGDGDRNVFVRLRNEGGNSEMRLLTVTLDETPPHQDPQFPLAVAEAPGTNASAVNLLLHVGFNEAVNTLTSVGTAPGLISQAVSVGGAAGSKTLAVSVSPMNGKAAGMYYDIHVQGSVAEAGELVVSFAPGSVVDRAGNALDVSGIGAAVTLESSSTAVKDWRLFD